MKRLRMPAIVIVSVLTASFGWWRFGTRYVPTGQPPLATLDPHSLGALKDDFNRFSGQTRVIVLLSPT